jgi:hypothetical protein
MEAGMKKSFLLMGLLLALGVETRVCAAEQAALPEKFGSWQKQSCGDASTQADLAHEAAQVGSTMCSFKSGADSLAISLWKYHDSSGAYEIYTAALSPSMQPSTVGGPSAIDAEKFVTLIGDYILEVRPPTKTTKADLELLVKLVGKSADRTPLPPIRGYLPQGFTDGTQRYALGPKGFHSALAEFHGTEFDELTNALGFDSGAEAMLAEYHGGKDSGVVLLVEYPTPQLAEQHLKHLEAILQELDKLGKTKIERRGSLLLTVLEPTSASYADGLRAGVRYQTAVMWHEPTHTITDPPWTTILGKIITLTMIFMVVTVVLGVAFGGVRVVMKKLFPGKVFDRPNDMDVLQLGLSGKRIDSEDFY